MRKKALVVRSHPYDAAGEPWSAEGFDVRVTSNLASATGDALAWRPDVVVLDLEGHVAAVAAFLREWMARPETLRTPVVLISPEERRRLSDLLLRGLSVVRAVVAVDGERSPAPAA